MVMLNPTRRKAVIFAFIPMMLLYLIYTLKLHQFLPAIATWPTQRQIIVDITTLARHKLWPWTVKEDHEREHEHEGSDHHALPMDHLHYPPHPHPHSTSRVPFTRHIVAVGDLHGDMPNARRVLKFAGVTDDNGDWSGDVDFFVQTGDIIDRGDDTILLFIWMDRLRAQAAQAGGTVLSHLGNHEWMNAIGDWRYAPFPSLPSPQTQTLTPHLPPKRYVYPSELKTFGSIAARQRMLTSGRIGRSWAANYTSASRLPLHPSIGPPNTPYPPISQGMGLHVQKDEEDVHWRFEDDEEEDEDDEQEHEHEKHERGNDHHAHQHQKTKKPKHNPDPLSHAALSFVHGGLSPTYPDLLPFPSKINALGTSLLAKLQNRPQPPPHPPHPYPGFPPGTTVEEARMYSANGPLWYRGWAMEDEATVCKQVDAVLKKTGTRRMIMGHTPDFQNIKSRCNGKILIIDTGISHAYGGVLSALSIHYSLHPISGDGEEEERWLEREIVSALYPDRTEVLVEDEREVVGSFGGYHHHDRRQGEGGDS
ncbi:hypothetical protein GALMADRAFT_279371 [Galerina marginata CBS 339.88]|uniref:Calcineurin-like phosphoesterase domain-containing protein n=1 Tax=Galerina marginata (strain CBS 339.88) TaxID=685588 RepID=A0A067T8E1_GALM3|nr:hypothetical protein GALMADRAFT_279371 [Galerina marginata CBS 339.88]